MNTQSGGEIAVNFRGRAGEWFGIWIVNLLLSIITIGIYSAWAKVRRLKYFYNNTFIDDRNFDYHATGWQILKGRLIFIGGYIVFSLLVSLSPVIGIILVIALLAVIPWLLVRAMRFNARMTSFSNVRFDFLGTTGRAAVVYMLVPIAIYIGLIGIFLGGGYLFFAQAESATDAPIGIALMAVLAIVLIPLAFAFYDRMVKDFTISNHYLGGAGFNLEVALKPLILAQLAAVAWVVVVGGIGVVVTGFSFVAFADSMEALERGDPSGGLAMIGLFYFLFFLAFIPAAFIYQAIVRNVIYNHTGLAGGHSFRSDVNPIQYFWIGVSNFVITVLTLGLMLPWCQIRMMKYLSDHTHIVPGGSLDDFVGEQVAAGHAVGDAFSDFEAVDVGLPV